MFSFFDGVANFLNLLVSFGNFFLSGVTSLVGSFSTPAVAQFFDTVAEFPPEVVAISSFSIFTMVFRFLRGR